MSFQIDAAGYCAAAQQITSPNFDDRPENTKIRLVVIHAISLPPDEFGGPGVIDLFCNQLNPQHHPYYQTIAGLKVSAHFFIRRDGALIQFVPCTARAWHAGPSVWQGIERCNDYSIGIELEGSDTQPFTPAQYSCLQQLLPSLYASYPIEGICGHADIAPGRKTDPGPCFDWQQVVRPTPQR